MKDFDFIKQDKLQADLANFDNSVNRIAKWRHFIHHTLQKEGANRADLTARLDLLNIAREELHARLEALEQRPELSANVVNLQNNLSAIQACLKGFQGSENPALDPGDFKPDWGNNSVHGEGRSTRDYDILAYAAWWLEMVHIPAIKAKEREFDAKVDHIKYYLTSLRMNQSCVVRKRYKPWRG